LGGKRHRLNFRDLETATNEAEAKASQLSGGDVDAVQLSGWDRLVYGRALDAVKEFDLPLDAVAIEYSEAWKPAKLGFSKQHAKRPEPPKSLGNKMRCAIRLSHIGLPK
jgi:hypothetical protein